MPVTGGQLFGRTVPIGIKGYKDTTTPSPVSRESGSEGILDNSPAYYWLGMVLLLVAWRAVIEFK